MPVAGLLQPTARREHVAAAVPANGPVARMSGFSGSERVGARRELGEEVAEQEALAADVQAGPVLVERLDRRRQGGQVEPQHASGVEVHASPHCRAAPRTMVFQGGPCYNVAR